ncbi:Rne/Rng family ribonuclease [Pendulispora brunnea]|uniref:Rne/Rng family ribonuclease n=1 Tax=Pendulispora brunnea TaxID=2905690 RepID=A0ABZ2K5W1_9BACT
MSKNILVISVDIRETRVALIEGGIIAELHIERRGKSAYTVGNVYLGKVTRVLPGLQAAFVDIGQERAAFLHVEDLIRPDDFETYLAGGAKRVKEDTALPEVTGDEELDAEAEEILETAPPPTAKSVENVTASLVEPEEAHPAHQNGAALDADVVQMDDSIEDSRVSLPSLAVAVDEDDDEEPEEQEEQEEQEEEEGPSSEDSIDEDEPSRLDLTDEEPSRLDLSDEEPSRVDLAEEASPSLDSIDDEEDDDEEGTRPTNPEIEAAAPVSSSPELAAAAAEDAPVAETFEAAEDAAWDAPSHVSERPPSAARATLEPLPDFPGMPGFTITDPNAPVPRAPSPPRAGNERNARGARGQSNKRSRHRRGRDRDQDRDRDRRGGRDNRDRDGGREGRDGRSRGDRSSMPNRISKTTPIREVVREGQEIIVQVTKDPIGTKGARCSSHVSLPGRYVVYLPTVDHIGISKRIGSEKERSRLREAIETVKPPSGGLIVRTVAEGLTKKQLKQDVGYLVRLWGEIAKKKEEGARAPHILMSELDLVLKTARDLFTDEVHQIVIDDRHQYERLCRFVEMFAPDRLKDIIYYSGDEPIFDAYGIEDEIGRALSRKVPLPSGGYLIIDQAEALTAIDVNTGRFVGKGSKDMEETILKTNLEAVHEIAYQLRFRNIGGLIILDLIDMERHQNREKVRRSLEELLQKDKAKTTLNRISDLGLIEMTRKRTRESLGRLLHEPCFYCDGTGQLQSKETIAYEILREIRRKRQDLPGYTVLVNAHPAVADVLANKEKEAVADAENRYMRKITVVPRKEYHLEQFDLQGK